MRDEINLLRNLVRVAQPKKTLRLARLISIVSLFSVSLLSVGLFLLRLRSPITSLRSEETSVLSTLSVLSTKGNKMVFINDRLTTIDELIKRRTEPQVSMENLLKIVPSQVVLSKLKVEGMTVSLTASSPSLVSLEKLIANITDLLANKQLFKKVVIGGIAVDKRAAMYSLSLEGELL